MALLLAEPTIDANGNAIINTSAVYGHDAIAHLLFAPVAQAKSASFPKATFGLSEKVVYKTCNRIVKINNEIPPMEPKDECCEGNSGCPEVNIEECFIPVRNFKSNEPNGKGYRDQLQIVFTDGQTRTGRKEITIPNPKDNIDAALIKSLLQPHLDNGSLYFGLIKCEMDILPWGYLRFYAKSKAEGEALLKSLVQLSKGTIKPKSFRASDRDRDNDVGLYKPDRAYLLDFEGKLIPGCKRIDLS